MKAPAPATVETSSEPKPYPDRLCHIDYTAHPHRCGCLSGDDEAQRRFDEYQRGTKMAPVDGEEARLTAECDALKRQLTERDEHLDALRLSADTAEAEVVRLRESLKFYAEREHYHFESANWDTVSGEPANILWNGDEPDFIEDGSVARAALNSTLIDSPAVDRQEFASTLSDTGQAQFLALCRGAAQRCEEQHAYMASASSDPHNWFPHKWVIDAMRSLLQVNAYSQRSTINQLQARIEELVRGRGQPVDEWRDMASAPRDGTMVRLLVEFEEHSTEDADQAPTIGANNFDHDGEDRWQFAGWCWSHDHFVEGKGVPVGWLPMLLVHQAPAALPDGYCIMPRSLTAENGAKALLLGEFKVTVTKECPECAELDDLNEHCEICDGEGQYSQSHTISWDQIKFIYSKAVGGLSLSPGRAELQAARFAKLDRLRGEALTFTYKHPSTTERRSVSLSRAEVAEGMEATLYEKLVAQLCQCESVGETNVVDCNCHQYGHDFERVAETDTEGSAV